jgi:hypothetical protein
MQIVQFRAFAKPRDRISQSTVMMPAPANEIRNETEAAWAVSDLRPHDADLAVPVLRSSVAG